MLDRVKVTPANRVRLTLALWEIRDARDRMAAKLPHHPIEVSCDAFRVVLSSARELDELIRVLQERVWQAEAESTHGPSQNIAE